MEKQQTICLCMIVKNESHVITRCLGSVRPLLDTWVIVDTGSTDGTQQIIRDHLRDLPGELFERPWVDFAHNRSEALALARHRAEYVLIIDADEVLEFEPGFTMPDLRADSYLFPMRSGGLSYYKTQLVRDELDWRFIGIIHEYIFSDRASLHLLMEGLHTLRIPDGARSRDPLTYRRDALLLEDALLREPGNARHMFYLAQSYADANEPLLALDRYARRVAMGGWAEETWYSLYRIAFLKRQTGVAWPETMNAFLAAYNFYPSRAEPLFQIGYHYQTVKEYAVAYLFFAQAMQIPFPKTDLLYVEHQVYEVLLPIEYSVASYYIGRHREAIETANRMLANPDLTGDLVEKLVLNRSFSLEALYPKRTSALAKRGKLIVCVILEEAESLSAACLESLQAAEGDAFQVVVVENGQASESPAAVPEGLRLTRRRSPKRLNWAGCLNVAAEGLDADDILLVMRGRDRLQDANSLNVVTRHFQDYDCALMYGQFTWADGKRGNALPLASAEDLERHRWKEQPLVPLAFRCGLLFEAEPSESMTALELLQRAGFERIRFNDQRVLVRERS